MKISTSASEGIDPEILRMDRKILTYTGKYSTHKTMQVLLNVHQYLLYLCLREIFHPIHL